MMNKIKFVRSLFSKSNPSPENLKLTTGVLYELHPPGSKVTRVCLYKDAEISIRRTKIPHQFQLVVQKVIEEGEEPQDSDDELDDERAFLIDVGLKFINTKYEGHLGFKWRDPLSATVGGGFEFIVEYPTDSDKVVRDKFALAVAKCAWERMHERSYEEGEEAEFQKIVDDAEAEDLENLLNSVTIDESDILAAVADHKPDLTPVKQQPPLRKPKEPAALAMGIITVSVIGSLFLFDPHTSEFVLLDKEVALSVVEMSKFTYFINVISNRKNYVSQLVDPDMNAVFNNEHRSLIWNYFDSTGSYSFSFKAADERHYESLHQGMTKAAYETLSREP
ncbi:Vacuolar import and degradation protein 27, partial [Kickxella alabastrina]